MSENRVWFAGICVATAGACLLLETFLGIIYVMMLDYDGVRGLLMVFCLTAAFPVFLIGFASLRKASIALWIFFIIQWINSGPFSPTYHMSSPLHWFHGDATFAGAVLVSLPAWIFFKAPPGEQNATLLSIFTRQH